MSSELIKITEELNNNKILKEQGVTVHKIEQTSTGFSLYVDEPKQSLPWAETGSVIYRDEITRDTLDLIRPKASSQKPHEVFKRAIEYYHDVPLFGSVVDTLVNFSFKGFENDTDDDVVKYFFDSWNLQVNFDQILEWIFQDFYRTGFVRTYKVLGKYDPGITYLKPKGELVKSAQKKRKARGARKVRWAKSDVPVRYTVLNPTLVEIEGSLLFDTAKTTLKPSEDLKAIIKGSKEPNDSEKEMIKKLPADFKRAISEGKNIPLDPLLLGTVDYRKQPYERYPKPRGIRSFDSIEYKEKLKEADFSTLDGITNAILKITIGNDNFPVTNQEEIGKVAQLFNTAQKSFNVVWNHTLKMEKITSPEISAILGQDKYKQVNEDLTGAYGVVRALIDGVGNITVGSANLAVKSIIEEINYGRRQVTRWIYKEYQQIAMAAGFDHYPKIRWDSMALRDEIMVMNLVQGMIDRRIISYQTGLELMGYDYDTVLAQLQEEKPLVLKGDIGIIGSPYNPKIQPWSEDNPERDPEDPEQREDPTQTTSPVNKVQQTPEGTPSEGRPRGKPGKKKVPKGSKSKKSKSEILEDNLLELGEEEYKLLLGVVEEKRTVS